MLLSLATVHIVHYTDIILLQQTQHLPHSPVIHEHLRGQLCQEDPGRNTSTITVGTAQYTFPFGCEKVYFIKSDNLQDLRHVPSLP